MENMNPDWKIKSFDERSFVKLSRKYLSVLSRILSGRGIVDENAADIFLHPDYERDINDPFLFPQMEKAVNRIEVALKKDETVCIFGDYDADGVTATVVLFETLKSLGFSHLEIYIPDRQTEGYGLNNEALNYIKGKGVSLIITVDCGITNFGEAQKSKELGIDLIITDHHHVPEKLPEALAVINPHQNDSPYPFSDLAGVGVAFKLAQALTKKLAPGKMEQTKWLLDLVAIGTIADCVPLKDENRVLAKFGLVVLSKTRRVGLKEMFKVGRIRIDNESPATTEKISFQIAPRINAAGRMDHANAAYQLLIEKSPVQARILALELEGKNQDRQKTTNEIVKEVETIAVSRCENRPIVFASAPHWRSGLLGLVAGRIAEKFRKPTIILQVQDNLLVGSLRSIPGINIIESLEECQEYLIKFGGHAQAAGVTLELSNWELFLKSLEEAVLRRENNKSEKPIIEIDAEILPEEIDWELWQNLKQMEPFGEGNTTPLLQIKNVLILEKKIVGNGTKHVKFLLKSSKESPKVWEAIGFGKAVLAENIHEGDLIDSVFSLEMDDWNNQRKLQLRLIDFYKLS